MTTNFIELPLSSKKGFGKYAFKPARSTPRSSQLQTAPSSYARRRMLDYFWETNTPPQIGAGRIARMIPLGELGRQKLRKIPLPDDEKENIQVSLSNADLAATQSFARTRRSRRRTYKPRRRLY